MARKKKETAEEIKETVEIVATETAEVKKPVRRGRKPAVKKAEEKSEEANSPTGTPMTAEEVKKEEIAPAGAQEKPKRARKTVKKTEPPKAEKKEEVKAPVAAEPTPEKKTATRAEKNEALRGLIKELLTARAYKWSELLDECAKLFEKRVEDKDAHSANDVRGRIGSVFDLMKKENEVVFEGGMYALKGAEAKKPVEVKEEKQPEKAEILSQKEEKREEKTVEKQLPAVKEEAKLAPVFDMTLLLGAKEEKKGGRGSTKPVSEKKEDPKKTETATEKLPAKTEEKPAEKPKKSAEKAEKTSKKTERKSQRTTEERLKESFLRKIRSLGGKYFEYYSVYLLERYSLRNGRRIDGLKVSGGDHDGGIDGEIEVTDRIGFRETIYIQAKNWNPNCGKQESWVIGETNLQQFIGAVAYRQAKEGKQNCRGIFMTTSYFTAGAKEMLNEMSDKFVGYDGDDLFEAAKECSFGLIQKDGQWVLDEKLLAGDKAFFNLY